MLVGIHNVFPPDGTDVNDPLKKLLKMEAVWALHKDILGFMFDGTENTI